MEGGREEHFAFSKCKRNTVLSHSGIITLQPTYSKAPSADVVPTS